MSLYNDMRPATFDEVVGQEKTVAMLRKEISSGDFKNAYLFTGVRGTGKTTSARIMAAAMNCENLEKGAPCGECPSCKAVREGISMDVYELDAASNNSVEDVRSILEKVQYKPVGKRKVFILDEVHMLSNSASNALLKVLEEPPKDVSFILCTTEDHKVLPTIRSRCSVFLFEKITRKEISDYLQTVCKVKNVQADGDALQLIAKAADGAMRDALSILDQLSGGNETLTAETVAETLGLMPEDAVFDILSGIVRGDTLSAIQKVRQYAETGNKVSYLISDLITMLLDVVDVQLLGTADELPGTMEYKERVSDLAFQCNPDTVFSLIEAFREVLLQKGSANIGIVLLTTIAGLANRASEIEELKGRVAALEAQIKSRAVVMAETTPQQPVEQPEEQCESEEPPASEPSEEDIPDDAPFDEPDEDVSVPFEESTPAPADDFVPAGDELSPFEEELPSLDEIRAEIIREDDAKKVASAPTEVRSESAPEPAPKPVEETSEPQPEEPELEATPETPAAPQSGEDLDDFARQFGFDEF